MNLAALIADPLTYIAVLALGVGLGLPMGAMVVGAGVVFGGVVGVVVVAIAQAIGLVVNWRLCRHWYRRWVIRRLQRRRSWPWLLAAIDTRLNWQTLLLLRLALLPMALVSACCALSATAWRPYALSSLVLLPRFALMVQAGAFGAATVRGTASVEQKLVALTAAVATVTAAALVARSVRSRLAGEQAGRTASRAKGLAGWG